MTFVQRWLGAFLMALALPGLLLPGSLDFSVCLCAPARAADNVELASCCVSKCCESSEDLGPTLAKAHAGCPGCREFTTLRRDDSTPTSSTQASIVAFALPARVFALEPVNELAWTPAIRPTSRAHPPPITRLPLRI